METVDVLVGVIRDLQRRLEDEQSVSRRAISKAEELDEVRKIHNEGIGRLSRCIENQKEVIQTQAEEFKRTVAFYQARDEDGWGYWRDRTLQLEKENKFLKQDRDTWKSWCSSGNKLHDETTKQLKKQLGESIDIFQDLAKVTDGKNHQLKKLDTEIKEIHEKWLKAEAEKMEWLQAGYARR